MRNTLKTVGALALVMLASCSKQTTIEPTIQLVVSDYSTEADLLAVDLGKRIAKSLKDENFREFVGEELKKQFDGDDNFLILKTERDAINSRREGGSFLEMLYPQENAAGRTAGVNNLVKTLEEKYPLLQVAFPELEAGDVNDWLANPTAVKVVVLPANYTEDAGITGAIAYDAEGNQTNVPLKEEPNETVIVLTRNERVVGIPKESLSSGRTSFLIDCPIMLRLAPVYETDNVVYYDRYLLGRLCDTGGGGGGGGTGGGGSGGGTGGSPLVNCACDRECNSRKEMIAKVRFPGTSNLQWAEDWPLGKPEMRFVQMRLWDTGAVAFANAAFTHGKRKDWKNGKWITMNRQWNYWNEADHGNTEAYFVFEEDDVPWAWQTYDKTYTLTSKFNGVNKSETDTWTSSTGLSAKDCGDIDVFFCEDITPPTIYNTGDFQFELTQY